jgi:hypothetical protein
MTLDELMQDKAGAWENDVATVRNGAYLVQVAKKVDSKIVLTDEGLRSFPELAATKPAVIAPAAPVLAATTDKKAAAKKV